jgi:hypothetical protein
MLVAARPPAWGYDHGSIARKAAVEYIERSTPKAPAGA